MAKRGQKGMATVGVADHWGWAILIAVGSDGAFLDRRRVELVDRGMPAYPHHHEALSLPTDEGVALVQRVAQSVNACASARLAEIDEAMPETITGIAIRESPALPATIAERLAEYRAQNVADSVMYRDALARAAAERGWAVHLYNPRRVLAEAAAALGRTSINGLLEKTGAALGPPWQKDHRIAMAAAIAAASRR